MPKAATREMLLQPFDPELFPSSNNMSNQYAKPVFPQRLTVKVRMGFLLPENTALSLHYNTLISTV